MEWVKIAKVGLRGGNQNGSNRVLSDSDLKMMVNALDTEKREPPLCLAGSTNEDDPAFGWVERLKVNGEVLEAQFKQLHPDVARALKRRRYDHVSISVDRQGKLRRVTIHGMENPPTAFDHSYIFSINEFEPHFDPSELYNRV